MKNEKKCSLKIFKESGGQWQLAWWSWFFQVCSSSGVHLTEAGQVGEKVQETILGGVWFDAFPAGFLTMCSWEALTGTENCSFAELLREKGNSIALMTSFLLSLQCDTRSKIDIPAHWTFLANLAQHYLRLLIFLRLFFKFISSNRIWKSSKITVCAQTQLLCLLQGPWL